MNKHLHRLEKLLATSLAQGETPFPRELKQFVEGFVRDAVDLSIEATLPSGYAIDSKFTALEENSDVFLTGATGFLGTFLLNELIQQTDINIYCLIRSSSPKEARRRLQSSFERTFGSGCWPERRIVPIVGDISKPLLGLSSSEFEHLASNVGAVYHNAASVNLLSSYESLKSTNVQGTIETLRLASYKRPKLFHHVSTVAAYPLSSAYGNFIREDAPPGKRGLLYGGYAQSKWVAEQLVVQAKEKGLPVCIYRPGIIAGHSRTGSWKATDMTCRMLKMTVQNGICPDREFAFDLAPVDYVSRALVHLSRYREVGRIYHLVNPVPVPLSQIVGWIRDCGYSVRVVPYDDWKHALASFGRSEFGVSPLSALFIWSGSLSKMMGATQENVVDIAASIFEQYARNALEFESVRTTRDLARSGISCPILDYSIMRKYLAYLVKVRSVTPGRTSWHLPRRR